MVPAPFFEDIETILNGRSEFREGGYFQRIPQHSHMVGVIFFDQNLRRPEVRDLLSNLNLLHQDSGQLIHFLLAGVSMFSSNRDRHAVEIGRIDGTPHFHVSDAFLSMRNGFEKNLPEWRYSYGMDLILVDVVDYPPRRLDFNSALFYNIETLIRLGIARGPTEFIGRLISLRRHDDAKSVRHMVRHLIQDGARRTVWEMSCDVLQHSIGINIAAIDRYRALQGGGA